MKAVFFPTIIEIELVGGPYDGKVMTLENAQKKIKVEGIEYTDTFTVSKKGLEIYRYSKGAGSLSQNLFEQ